MRYLFTVLETCGMCVSTGAFISFLATPFLSSCRGALYEIPGDEVNREQNRVYLQEFVDAMSG